MDTSFSPNGPRGLLDSVSSESSLTILKIEGVKGRDWLENKVDLNVVDEIGAGVERSCFLVVIVGVATIVSDVAFLIDASIVEIELYFAH